MARLARVRFRLWQRLLTPGWGRPTAAARLRGWARVLDWEAAAMTVGRRAITTRALWTPLRVWREAGNEVAKFGAEVEAVSGVPPREQRRQLWWLGVRYGLNALSYLDYQLYRPERRRRAEAWVQEREYYRVVRWYNRLHEDSDVGTMLDKRGFSEWCRRHGLPAVPTLVEYDHGALIAAATPGDPEASLPAADLFSKPSDATGGHGTERWRYGGDRTWTASSDGRVRGGRELLAELAETSLTLPRKYGRTSRRIMLQPCLRNHADLLPLTPGALGVTVLGSALAFALTRHVAIGSLTAAVVYPATLFVERFALGRSVPTPLLVVGTGMGLWLFWTHRSNIRRLLRGEESKLAFGQRVRGPDA